MKPILNIKNLTIAFPSKTETNQVVHNISFQLNKNEILGIVGESGSGKSVTALSILGLLPKKKAVVSGKVEFENENLITCSEKQFRKIRGNQIAMIFQEPMSSLNPSLTCGYQVLEILLEHTKLSKTDAKVEVIKLFNQVKLPRAEQIYSQYPHQISGGQMQRVMIAMAIACKPKILIADEPTTALDVTVQKEIILLLKELQQETEMSVIFITHDLALISEIANRVLVMYKGNIVEQGLSEQVFKSPQHQYTKALIQSKPSLDVRLRVLPTIDDFLDTKFEEELLHRDSQRNTEIHRENKKANPCKSVESVSKEELLHKDSQRNTKIHKENKKANPCKSVESVSKEELLHRETQRNTEKHRENKKEECEEKKNENPKSKIQNSKFISAKERKQNHKLLYAKPPILEIKNLATYFTSKKNIVKAVDDISLKIYEGETLGLVGESGCGKTTLGRTIMGLEKATKGTILYQNKDITNLINKERKNLSKEIQIIFQDPFSSLNPRILVGEAILEPMLVHKLYNSDKERKEKVFEILEKVGLEKEHYYRYPHEFSGGQRQRIGIARTIALQPKLIICDESVSALDVSVQAQVLNLLNILKYHFNFTYIFISHDLAVVKYMADQLVVMNQGKIEEIGDADEIYANPEKEYTKALIDAIPKGI